MGLEKYQPTEQDITHAEQTMTSRDKAFTGIREDHIKSIREAGKKAGIEIDTERLSLQEARLGETPEFRIQGTVRRHLLSVTGFPQSIGQDFNYRISIDGITLASPSLTHDLFEKYFRAASTALLEVSRKEEENQEITEADSKSRSELTAQAQRIAEELLS